MYLLLVIELRPIDCHVLLLHLNIYLFIVITYLSTMKFYKNMAKDKYFTYY